MAQVSEYNSNRIRREFGISAISITKNSETIKKYIELKFEVLHSLIMTSVLPETIKCVNKKEMFRSLFSRSLISFENICKSEMDRCLDVEYHNILHTMYRKVTRIIMKIDLDERKVLLDGYRNQTGFTTCIMEVKRVTKILTCTFTSISERVFQTVQHNFFENNIIHQIIQLNNVFMELLQETKQIIDVLHKCLQEILLLSKNTILSENEHRIDKDNILRIIFEEQKEQCDKEFISAFAVRKKIFNTAVESLLGNIVKYVNKYINEDRELRTSFKDAYSELLSSLKSTLSEELTVIQLLSEFLLKSMSENILEKITLTHIDCQYQSDWLKTQLSIGTERLSSTIKNEISEVNSKVSSDILMVKCNIWACNTSTLISPQHVSSLIYHITNKIATLCCQNEKNLYGVQRMFRCEVQLFYLFLVDKIYTGPSAEFPVSSPSNECNSLNPVREVNSTSLFRSKSIEEIIEEPTSFPWGTISAIKKAEHGSASEIHSETEHIEDIARNPAKTITNTVPTNAPTSLFQMQWESVDQLRLPCSSKYKDSACEFETKCYDSLSKSSLVEFPSISFSSEFQRQTRSIANISSNETHSVTTSFATTNKPRCDSELSQNHSLLKNKTRENSETITGTLSASEENDSSLIVKAQSNVLEHNATSCENYSENINNNILGDLDELPDSVETSLHNILQFNEFSWENLSRNVDSIVNRLSDTRPEFNLSTTTSIASKRSTGQWPHVDPESGIIVSSETTPTSSRDASYSDISSTEQTIQTESSATSGDQEDEFNNNLLTIIQRDCLK